MWLKPISVLSEDTHWIDIYVGHSNEQSYVLEVQGTEKDDAIGQSSEEDEEFYITFYQQEKENLKQVFGFGWLSQDYLDEIGEYCLNQEPHLITKEDVQKIVDRSNMEELL